MLDDEGVTANLNLTEMLQERAYVLCPENETINVLSRQAYAHDLAVVGIHHVAVARPQTPDKPLSVESGNVGFVTGRDYHRFVAAKQNASRTMCGNPFRLKSPKRS
jgi:hypothetical protein